MPDSAPWRPPRLTAEELEALLAERAASLESSPGAAPTVVFDGDGTLWTADVGELVFTEALEQGRILDQAHPALRSAAEAHGIDASGTTVTLARRLYEKYLDRTFPERPATEMMVWCYAGWSYYEWARFARETLERRGLDTTYVGPVHALVRWARRRELRVVVISASPQPVVEAAVEPLGIGAVDVAAGLPAVAAGRVRAELARPLPYAEDKVRVGRQLFGRAPWLAAFGDSSFDVPMLAEAEQAVAVRPKAELERRYAELRGLVELSTDSNQDAGSAAAQK